MRELELKYGCNPNQKPARIYMENGADLHAIQKMLGHADISSTQMYNQLIQKDIKDIYTKAHPRAHQKT